jgi:hypothetical protein
MQKLPIIMRDLEKCPECLQRFHVEWQGKFSRKGISFIYFFLLIHLTNKEMNKNEEIVSNTFIRIIIIMGYLPGQWREWIIIIKCLL